MSSPSEPNDAALEELVFACLEAADPHAELQRRAGDQPGLLAAATRLLLQVERLEHLDAHALAATTELPSGPRADDRSAWPTIPGVELHALQGRGGQGFVFRGQQSYLQRAVAVKVLAPELQTPAFVDRFRREARMLAGLQHHHIVTCHDAGLTAAGQCYLVMELIDGPNLRQWLDANGALPAAIAVQLVQQLANALDHAQQLGFVHRDVKPENVLLQPAAGAHPEFAFVPKLADLGLARPVQGGDGMTMLTPVGAVLGTPNTMAPEQFDAPQSVDQRADIYGLGCILHHALTGRPAFRGTSMTDLVMQKAAVRDPATQPPLPGVAAALSLLTWRMLAWSPNDRPKDYAALHDALRGARAECAPTPTAAKTRTARSAGIAAVLVSLGALTLWRWPTDDTKAPREPNDAAPRERATEPPPGRPALAAGTSIELFANGGLDAWQTAAPQRWSADESGRGVLVNTPRERCTASRDLPGGDFVLRGGIEPRFRYVSAEQPRVPITSVGWRLELGADDGLALTIRALGDDRFSATWQRQQRTAGEWQTLADLGSCEGVFLIGEPLQFEVRWSQARLEASCGPQTARRAAQATAVPATDWQLAATPQRLEVHADRGVAIFSDWVLAAVP